MKVVITQNARDTLESINSKTTYLKLKNSIQLLVDAPNLGVTYDPIYDAARPPMECREFHVPGTNFTLYHYYNKAANTVYVFYIADQRKDPKKRFKG